MASIDYISEYYKLSKCKYSNIYRVLTIQIRNSIYNQYYELFLKYSTSRQKYHEAEQLCKLWFFIHFNCSLGNSKLSIESIEYAIKCNNRNQAIHYKNILDRLNLITISRNVSSYTKDNQLHYTSDICSYQIHELESNLDFSSRLFKVIDYPILYSDIDYRSLINKPINLTPIPYIEVSSSQLSNCGSKSFSRKYYFYIEDFYSRYNRLKYYNLIGQLDEQLTSELKNSVAYLHDDGRVYHRFHSIPSEYRNTRVYMDNERLVEYSDLHNAQHSCLYALLDDTVPEAERQRYFNLTISGKFYEDIRDWVNGYYNSNWSRDDAKLHANKYHNIKNKSLDRAKEGKSTKYISEVCIDKYFETVFPNIREFIYNHKETLHNELNQVETKILIMNICKDLYEKYGIEAITVHDAVYVKESDAAFLKSNSISIESMFNEYLEIYNYLK